jgi:hypothetical protein
MRFLTSLEAKKRSLGLLLKMDFEIAYNRVDWGFVREVLLQKGFPPTMVLRYATGLGEGTGWG